MKRLSCPVFHIYGRKFELKYINLVLFWIGGLFLIISGIVNLTNPLIPSCRNGGINLNCFLILAGMHFFLQSLLIYYILRRPADKVYGMKHIVKASSSFVVGLAIAIWGSYEMQTSSTACYQSGKHTFGASTFGTFGVFISISCLLIYSLSVYCAALTPEDEDTPVLKYARCTCISEQHKKGIILLPFLIVGLLAITNVATTWSSTEGGVCNQAMHLFILVAGCTFIFDGFVALYFFYGTGARRSRIKLSLLIFCTLGGLALAVWGAVYLPQDSCVDDSSSTVLFDTAMAMKVLLIAFNSIILLFTICCKTEDFLDSGRLLDVLIEEQHPIPKHLSVKLSGDAYKNVGLASLEETN